MQKGFAPIIYLITVVLISGGILSFLIFKNNASKTSELSQPSPTLSPTISSLPTATLTSKPSPTSAKKVSVTSSPTKAPTSAPTATSKPLPKVTCTINTSVTSGWSPVWVRFDYTSSDPSRVVAQEWDLDGNGTWESEASGTDWTYRDVKSYEAKLRLKLKDGSYSDTCTKTIIVNAPSVTCNINASTTSGSAPLVVKFYYGADFHGTDDYVKDVQWDFNGDGTWDTAYDYSQQNPSPYTYSSPGSYTVKMHVKTNKGTETDICTKTISVN